VTEIARQPAAGLLTIDVEDWYYLSGCQLSGHGTLRPEILARQLDRLLGLLARHGCRATFFCLGGSLVDAPQLLRRIADAGHEVATHGWSHQPIHRTGLAAFREDLLRSLSWLQDVIGRPVLGYRAPAFSVPGEWLDGFYDICFRAGLRYDSSIFPVRGRRYGIADAPLGPHVVRQDGERRLVELPLSAITWLGRRWPVAGGGYWRIMPARLIRAAVTRVNREGRPMVTYLHPHEFDSERLSGIVAAGVSLRSLRHSCEQNLGRGSMYGKLDSLLVRRRFETVEGYLRDTGLL
jgi:polysaccharide deacetylase family protein (PEP-CTERM system associated)